MGYAFVVASESIFLTHSYGDSSLRHILGPYTIYDSHFLPETTLCWVSALMLCFVSCVPLTYPDTVFLGRKVVVHIMWLHIKKKHYFYIFTYLDKKLPIF